MKVLIIGNGGREHALAWKVAQSPQVTKIFVAPGNAGTALEAKTQNVSIAATDISKLIDFAQSQQIDLTIVGPETPLAAGIVDRFQAIGLAIFGPTQKAAQLESSKHFCKQFLQRHSIPTATYAAFTQLEPALEYLKSHSFPIVIKADGLAAGKGVVIADDFMSAAKCVEEMLISHRFGDAGNTVVIEEFLTGEELSFIVMVDGQHYLPLASSQDHKRRDAGDQGPNTGGMGAYSPAPLLTSTLEQRILQTIIEPTLKGLKQENIPYCGFLYAGLMITPEGIPKVLEFNCRLGDPETQPIMMRLQSNLITLCQAALNKKLNQIEVQWDPRSALTVVLTAGGYPFDDQKEQVISGLNQPDREDIKVFHAATKTSGNQILTDGGRVLGVSALGDTLEQAYQKAYARVASIHWTDCYYREDIGHKAMKAKIH